MGVSFLNMLIATTWAPPEVWATALFMTVYIGSLAACYVTLVIYVEDELQREMLSCEWVSTCETCIF
jgi:hypothetical protein